MAKLRRGSAYKNMKRPYTRKSKYRKKDFVRGSPNSRIAKFVFGDKQKKFKYKLILKAKDDVNLRDNSLESARRSCNRLLETRCGKMGYYMRLRKYPHHILRENAMATGAGADRMSSGMSRSFGKPVGLAARTKKGDAIFEIRIDENFLPIAKTAMNRAKCKLPGHMSVEITEN